MVSDFIHMLIASPSLASTLLAIFLDRSHDFRKLRKVDCGGSEKVRIRLQSFLTIEKFPKPLKFYCLSLKWGINVFM